MCLFFGQRNIEENNIFLVLTGTCYAYFLLLFDQIFNIADSNETGRCNCYLICIRVASVGNAIIIYTFNSTSFYWIVPFPHSGEQKNGLQLETLLLFLYLFIHSTIIFVLALDMIFYQFFLYLFKDKLAQPFPIRNWARIAKNTFFSVVHVEGFKRGDDNWFM